MAAHIDMKKALVGQDDDIPDFVTSGPVRPRISRACDQQFGLACEYIIGRSVSPYGHDTPPGPDTIHEDEKNFGMHLYEARQYTVPEFQRSYTDIAADNFYDPVAVAQSVPQTEPSQPSLLTPYRGIPINFEMFVRFHNEVLMTKNHASGALHNISSMAKRPNLLLSRDLVRPSF
ncbi:hypothetical protein IQ06DRAFT_353551 [Phaeosphaeriaceae sp. SRC1lsM3a]|nr:hypothetical protein IQ06DRAFT_353551 [Stagonospora sp. SRC1lsM3a]